jgi:haloalkane dehalogenase
MKFIQEPREELVHLRADPLLVEQELDTRPDVAEALEKAVGFRAGRVYWRSEHDHLYALELGDLGRGRPTTATVYGFWDRYEPRPPEHEIDADLLEFLLWFAGISGRIDPADVRLTAEFAFKQTGRCQTAWPPDAVVRTPEERFVGVPDFPYQPAYVQIEGLRMAYYASGSGDPILCLHGEPTWGYLYRRMMPILATVGRVVVPDLIGFGRSDKPVAENAYSYRSHVRWMKKFLDALDLRDVTIIGQDWGGLIGLRMLAEVPERFKRVVMMNTGLPVGIPFSDAFLAWRRFSQDQTFMDVPALIRYSLQRKISEAEIAAYGAPFPSKEFCRGALVFPRLVPIRPDHPGTYENLLAIETLKKLDIPVLIFWADKDEITKPGVYALQSIFPRADEPILVKDAGHFIQEDKGEEVAQRIVAWIATS